MNGNGPMQMIQQFMQFKNNFKGGNPQQIVQDMIKNGQISQEQYNQAVQQANQLYPLIYGGGRR